MNRQKTAKETYQSQKEDELSFWAGDQIIMFSKPNSEGRLDFLVILETNSF